MNKSNTRFSIKIELSTGATVVTDVMDIRHYAALKFSNSANIPLDGCWDILQRYLDSLSAFTTDVVIEFRVNGNTRYFNKAYIISIELIQFP